MKLRECNNDKKSKGIGLKKNCMEDYFIKFIRGEKGNPKKLHKRDNRGNILEKKW